MKYLSLLPIACLAAGLAWTQDRDFLTPNEVEQVRQAQEPNERLLLYVHFAKQRIDVVQNYLAKDKPGRSIFVHNNLEDYNKIVEAIDSVADDAIKHNRPIDKGMVAVLNAEKEFLDQLNKIHDSEPRDLERYKFVLEQAIDTTHDSRELSLEDSHKRGTDLAAEDAKEKKDREAMMPAKEVKDRHKAAEAEGEKDKEKKVPSLYRPGEKPQHPPE
jgi:hypothetical protein